MTEQHPFEHQLAFNSDYGTEIQDEIRAEHFCQCDLELTLQELDSGKCSCCGKQVIE